jgi:hypothetical protein
MTVEEVLLRHHQWMRHSSLSVLSILYPSLYERANKKKLVYDTCELEKKTRNSYHSSRKKSSGMFDLIYSDVWGPYPTNIINSYRYFMIFIDYFSHVTYCF